MRTGQGQAPFFAFSLDECIRVSQVATTLYVAVYVIAARLFPGAMRCSIALLYVCIIDTSTQY